jgi:hypothetical protein
MSRIDVTIKMPDMIAYLRKQHGSDRPLTPKEVAALRVMGNEMLRVIKQNWPVDTGTSRGAWSYYVNPSPRAIAFVFTNRVWYSSWITKRGERTVKDGGAPLFRRLLTAVWNAGKPKTFRLLREAIDKTELALNPPPLTLIQPKRNLSLIELLQRGG